MNNLKLIRKKKDLTQKELAERAGTSDVQIHRFEKAKTRITREWAVRLAKVLDCTPAEIMGFESFQDGKLDKKGKAEAVIRRRVEEMIDGMAKDAEITLPSELRDELIEGLYEVSLSHIPGGIRMTNEAFYRDSIKAFNRIVANYLDRNP
jgi:transcriptional regulator with XRE-family HTH domain